MRIKIKHTCPKCGRIHAVLDGESGITTPDGAKVKQGDRFSNQFNWIKGYGICTYTKTKEKCYRCDGTGKLLCYHCKQPYPDGKNCRRCHGKGYKLRDTTYMVRVIIKDGVIDSVKNWEE